MQHDVEQVEGYLAHGLPEIMSATILPAAVFLIMLWVDWRLALVMIVGLPLMWITKKNLCSALDKEFQNICGFRDKNARKRHGVCFKYFRH